MEDELIKHVALCEQLLLLSPNDLGLTHALRDLHVALGFRFYDVFKASGDHRYLETALNYYEKSFRQRNLKEDEPGESIRILTRLVDGFELSGKLDQVKSLDSKIEWLLQNMGLIQTSDALKVLELEFVSRPESKRVRESLGYVYCKHGVFIESSRGGGWRIEPLRAALESFERGFELRNGINSHFDIEICYKAAMECHLMGNQPGCMKYIERALVMQKDLIQKSVLAETNLRFFPSRTGMTRGIGHLFNEPEFYTKMGELGWREKYRTLFLVPNAKSVNQSALNLWRKHLTIVTDESLCRRLQPVAELLEFNTTWPILPNGKAIYSWSGCLAIQKEWEKQGRAPLVKISEEQIATSRHALETIGLPKDAWFVALHVRDQTLGKEGIKVEVQPTSNRDAKIEDYHLAVKAIVDRGGWVVRLGSRSMPAFPKIQGAIDYAHTDLKSDWLDIFLVANSRFFLGTASGMNGIPITYGVPSLMTNVSPMNIYTLCAHDIYMPKLMRCRNSGKLLTFKESLSVKFQHCFNTNAYDAFNVDLIDNTPEELRDVTVEMMDFLDGKNDTSAEDNILQAKFKEIADATEPYGINTRIGRDFLRAHKELLS